jgi:replication factor C subunit 1
MNQLWVDKYKPQTLDDIVGNRKTVAAIDNYVSILKDNPKLLKFMLITGDTGIGKTTIAKLLFKKHNYRVIEYNSTNIDGSKTIKNIIKNSFYYKNVLEMFNQDKRTTAIIIDEVDSLITLGSKGGIVELTGLLQKSKKTKTNTDKINTPIIFTCKNLNDKKIVELKKYTKEFKLKNATIFEMSTLIQRIVTEENIEMEPDVITKFIKNQGYDIRNNINTLYYLCCAHNKKITMKDINSSVNRYKKDNDYQLTDGVQKIFISDNVKTGELENIYHMDTFFIPLLIFENYLKIIFCKKCSTKDKLKLICEISKFNSLHDIIHDSIFKNNNWDILKYMPYFTTISANNLLQKYEFITDDITLNYTTLFTNISQYYIKNRKLINIIYNIEKIYINKRNVEYLIRMISYYTDNKIDKQYLIHKLKMYRFTNQTFIELLRYNKVLYNKITTNDKKEYAKLLD